MISKTLFLLLKNLTNQELERLSEYLRSTFFNKDENIVRLYVFLYEKKKLFFMFDRKKVIENFPITMLSKNGFFQPKHLFAAK